MARVASCLVVGGATALYTHEGGPPRAFVALFDGDYEAALPLHATAALDVTLPAATPASEVDTIERDLAQRLKSLAEHVGRAGTTLTFALYDGDDGAARAKIDALTKAGGGFEILPVLEDTPLHEGYAELFAEPPPTLSGVGLVPRSVMRAPSEDELDRARAYAEVHCAACKLGPDQQLAYEYEARDPAFAESVAAWRAELVSRAPPVFDDRFLDEASFIYDEMNRPAILLELTPEGATAFEALTRAHLDERVAIIVGGRIQSAPIVRGVITGGQVHISLGGGGPQALVEGRELLASLRKGVTLPAGTTLAWRAVSPAGATGIALAHALTIVLAIVAALALAFVLRHVLGPIVAPGAGVPPAVRVLVTVVGLASSLLLSRVPLPLPDEGGSSMLGMFEADQIGPSLIVLGSSSIVLAYLLVSAAVWLVPRWKGLRRGDLASRAKLGPTVAIVALAVSVLAGLAYVQLLRYSYDLRGVQVGVFALLLVGGSFLLWGVATLVSRFGHGNGFVVITVGEMGWSLVDTVVHGDLSLSFAAFALALALATTWLVHLRVRAGDVARRLPFAGVAPLDLGGLMTLVALALAPLIPVLALLATAEPTLVLLALVLAFGVLLSWRIARPLPLRVWGPAALVGLAPLAGIALVYAWSTDGVPREAAMSLAWIVSLVTLPVMLADIGAEVVLGLGRGPLVCVASTHDVDHADALRAALAGAGLGVVARGVRTRALVRFMGPWLPIELWVPAGSRQKAEAIVRDEASAALLKPW